MDFRGFCVVGTFYGTVYGSVFGLLLGSGEERGGGLETFDHLACLIVLADRLQEAHGLGGSHTDYERVDGGNQTDGKCPTPAVRLRNDEGTDECGEDPAQSPESLQGDHDAPANSTRRELRNQGGRHGKFRAQTQTNQETEDEQHTQGGCQGGCAGRQTVNQQGEGEDVAAAELIGE
ncbi:Uncharacterised protein [Mycobacterium tuberculosis]|nr:Uncharacterised protein [Mycobacterium tuberculosis]